MELTYNTELVDIKINAESQELIPSYQTDGASGADLKANLQAPVYIPPRGVAIIPTGIYLEIPKGYEVQIRPRSGLAAKSHITVLNTPGTIDSDYRGEIKVILINHSDRDFEVTHGMRIAQMVIASVCQANFLPTSEFTTSTRGDRGFGHTGTH